MYGKTLQNSLILAVFSVTSLVLSFIKFGGASSIALDSFPGYFVAGYYGPFLGGLVAFSAHLLSAATGGMPLGGIHVLIAGTQFICTNIFGFIPKFFNNIKFVFVSGIVAIVLNGCVAPFLIGVLFPELKATMLGLIPILTMVSALNIALAIGAIFFVRYIRKI